jgi:pimeloyl-[acyl-carrier protein] methyl ester esterase
MTLHRESRGSGGLPLVCLHGWGLNLRVFDALAEDLGAGREVQAIDLPGHGASPWDAAAADLEGQAARIAAVLPERCVLLGWSLGGQLALEIARRWPQRLDRLVLVATTPRFVADAQWAAGMAPAVMARFSAQLASDWHATVEEFLHLQVRGSRDATAALAGLQRALREHGQAQPQALAAGLGILRDADLRAAAAGIPIDTLVVSGQHDRITPPAASEWLAAVLPRARHVQLPRAGHAPFLSHAPDFNAALAGFLDAA